MTLLAFEEVTKHYGEELVLDAVSFELDRTEVEVIIGPSGSGKSTLLRCVNRLAEVDDGTIRFDGEPIAETDADELRRQVGMVFQDFNLFAHRTALGNVTLGLRRVRGFSTDEARERARRELDQVGLGGQLDSYPAELSGGQKQRVGIARALAMDPELLLFDEPTSALDPELIGEVLAVMRELADDGMTMLCVTHELGFARSVADRLTFLEAGAIIERGDPERLFTDPRSDRTAEYLSRLTGEY